MLHIPEGGLDAVILFLDLHAQQSKRPRPQFLGFLLLGPPEIVCILIRTLWLNEDIKKAIDAPRFHHQLLPNVIEYEKFFPGDLIDDLKEKGHEMKSSSDSGIIMGILKDKGIMCANSDYRKGGGVDGF
ncbi:uncharacterized protein TNCV_2085351 [Trichonephila clavipes]|uniref:Uncharacterized protein n=1 Tax=Trichonephila clavipes TaxID=2585209 RepID=A0A8X6RT16_TRICX|nr:uncharacterized protein TNCV_2085351 [Trichonephila clavipes]